MKPASPPLRRFCRAAAFSAVCFACLSAVGLSAFRQEGEVPVSSFAAAEDLIAIVGTYTAEVASIVDDADEFAKDDRRTRVGELAESIQALALALARHDQLPDGKTASQFAAAHKAAGDLYSASEHAAATSALGELKHALEAGADSERAVPEWGCTDQMYDLMNQVQLSLSSVSRGMRRLERRPDPVAQNAAFLAVVGHETRYLAPQDLSDDLKKVWSDLSLEMRDSAKSLNAAAKAKDQMTAEEAATRLTKSCDDCHAQIRDRRP